MRKLFGGRGGGGAPEAKKDGPGPLTNKTVQVGGHTVLVEHVLGLGGYGFIYRAVDISSGARFALKHLRLTESNIDEVKHEAKVMARLRGAPHVLRLHAVAFAGPKGAETDGFFLLDYCPGTLLDLMARHAYVLEDHTILHIFGSVAQALAAMHHASPPLAHRDIKAENVLMLPDGTWVVCDFGSATTRAGLFEGAAAIAAEEDVIAKHTTPAYRPPEMWDLQLMRKPLDTKVDMWALGVLLYVLTYGRLPFSGDSKLQIINGKYELPPHGFAHARPPQLASLVRALLQVDPARRPDIDELLRLLDAAARSITGQGAGVAAAAAAGPAAAAAANTPGQPSQAPAGALPQQQQQQQVHDSTAQQQQQQQQQLLQRMAAARQAEATRAHAVAAGGCGGGTFWGSAPADAAPGSPAHSGKGTPTTAAASEAPPDWARFGSPSPPPSFPGTAGADAAAPAASSAAVTSHAAQADEVEQQQQQQPSRERSPAPSGKQADGAAATGAAARGAEPPAGRAAAAGAAAAAGKRPPPQPPHPPSPSSAARGLRAHALPAAPASPHGSPVKGLTPTRPAADANGSSGRAATINGGHTSTSSSSRTPGGDLAQLQDIQARAAAMAAGGSRKPPPPSAAADGHQPHGSSDGNCGSSSGGGALESRGSGGRISEAAGMAAVLAEVVQLRSEVARLSDMHSVAVFRIKQLENGFAEQSAEVGRLQGLVKRLSSSQQHDP